MSVWTFSQTSGAIAHDGRAIGVGYSGNGAGMNNAGMQEIPDVGPIPQGRWWKSTAINHPHLGPQAIRLIADATTDTFGRDGFWIHGDNAAMNHSASCGCIVASLAIRLAMGADDDPVDVTL